MEPPAATGRIAMRDLQLRAATADDDAFLYDLHRRVLGDVIEATWGPWDDAVQQQFHRDWFDPEQVEIVLIDGRPAGMIQAHSADADTFYISRVEVIPEVQNRGVGTALMQHLVEHALQAGASAVELHVLELNRARGLYERLGFRVVAKEPPKLRMRLALH
ncbi:ribosomal protein S18 acetylase RimI-like enzyme [Kribbella steppae]|uniref:Ribosomal protein S18 acetylase RimI-like enzyme n=2 Tax=Kribbella steppae TaxID=2512223 RepID=A0A4R2H2U5_9ACTN|nr:GNAT family N-acetyltransferase [Kribbella steppae]TCO19192.1 ribosomal protein S18 acetylase RimI-like enzyme [Kribbella steppae]